MVVFAVVAGKCGDARVGGILWGAAECLDEALGETFMRMEWPLWEAQLGEPAEEFGEGVEEGRRLTPDEAVSRALNGSA
jgi:hypothetical protein